MTILSFIFSLFQLGLNEGALVISRSGLAKMGVVLELEAVQGCGRDSLIGLHTLTLSCNQLQVSEKNGYPGLLSRPSSKVPRMKCISPCLRIPSQFAIKTTVSTKTLSVSGNTMALAYAALMCLQRERAVGGGWAFSASQDKLQPFVYCCTAVIRGKQQQQ